MDNEFSFTVKLKQHSPLIHFQHDQYGATLRATELKPKLDKFLFENEFKDNWKIYIPLLVGFEKGKYEKMNETQRQEYGKKMHRALNYKVTIRNKGNISLEKYTIITEEKVWICYHNDLEVTFFSYEKDVLTALKKWLTDFFILHNFGLNQSKGFGGFTLVETGREDFERTIRQKYNVFFKKKFTNDWNCRNYIPIIKLIKTEYHRLKTGTNKAESRLFKFMKLKGINWERNLIKKKLKENEYDVFQTLKGKKFDDSITNYKYIRALLGLAEHNEFLAGNISGKVVVKIKDKFDGDKENEDKIIGRFQSPIQFKLFNNILYILPNDLPVDIFDHQFSFFLVDEEDKTKETLLFTKPTPSISEFSLVDFLEKELDYSYKEHPYKWQRVKGDKQ